MSVSRLGSANTTSLIAWRCSDSSSTPTVSAFNDLIAALEEETIAFPGQVVLVHGDTHYFRVDKPLVNSRTRARIENFTRVETCGEPDHHWVHVAVDHADPNVFTFRPRIVPANVGNFQPR